MRPVGRRLRIVRRGGQGSRRAGKRRENSAATTLARDGMVRVEANRFGLLRPHSVPTPSPLRPALRPHSVPTPSPPRPRCGETARSRNTRICARGTLLSCAADDGDAGQTVQEYSPMRRMRRRRRIAPGAVRYPFASGARTRPRWRSLEPFPTSRWSPPARDRLLGARNDPLQICDDPRSRRFDTGARTADRRPERNPPRSA